MTIQGIVHLLALLCSRAERYDRCQQQQQQQPQQQQQRRRETPRRQQLECLKLGPPADQQQQQQCCGWPVDGFDQVLQCLDPEEPLVKHLLVLELYGLSSQQQAQVTRPMCICARLYAAPCLASFGTQQQQML